MKTFMLASTIVVGLVIAILTSDKALSIRVEIVGEVVKIDGEKYIIKDDETGQEVGVSVSPETNKAGTIKVGDKVVVNSDGTVYRAVGAESRGGGGTPTGTGPEPKGR